MSAVSSVPAGASWQLWMSALRMHHWPKCLVVLVGLLPTGAFRDPHAVLCVIAAAGLFQCCAAGGYLVNDVLDLRRDRLHPRKRLRPIAAGLIGPGTALLVAVSLEITAIALAAVLSLPLAMVLISYAFLALLYSLVLKHAVVCDILTIAAIFVMRAIAGVEVLGVYVSPWFLASIGCLALLLALGKRLGEVGILSEIALVHRITLRAYQAPAWRWALSALGGATVICYAIAATISPTALLHPWVLITLGPVMTGVWRYTRLVVKGAGGEPERLVIRDPIMVASAAAWSVMLASAVLR